MKTFRCQVVDRASGKESVRVLTAETQDDVKRLLYDCGLLVGDVQEIRTKVSSPPPVTRKTRRKRVSLISRRFWLFEDFITPSATVISFALWAIVILASWVLGIILAVPKGGFAITTATLAGFAVSVILLLAIRFMFEFIIVIFQVAQRLDRLVELEESRGQANPPHEGPVHP